LFSLEALVREGDRKLFNRKEGRKWLRLEGHSQSCHPKPADHMLREHSLEPQWEEQSCRLSSWLPLGAGRAT
jgi:hypothetical protein